MVTIAERVSIQEDPIGATIGGAFGVAIGLYFIREGLKWRKIPERKRATLRLPLMAGQFHRYPTLSIVSGLGIVAISGSVMLASIYFAIVNA